MSKSIAKLDAQELSADDLESVSGGGWKEKTYNYDYSNTYTAQYNSTTVSNYGNNNSNVGAGSVGTVFH